MSNASRLLSHASRQFGWAVLTFALWMLWLALVVVFVAQVFMATRHEMAVPAFVQQRLEARFAEAGLKVNFDRATFDPIGRILVERPRVFLPGFADPVIEARAAYIGLNPWAAVIGHFEAREIRVVDGTVFVPAMLSPSGRPEPIARDIDALVTPGEREIVVRHVSARVSGLVLSIHGAISVPRAEGRSAQAVAQTVQSRFAEACRSAVAFTRRLEAFDQPSLELELDPTTSRGAIVTAELVARGFKLDAPVTAQVGRFRARTHFPLLGDTPSASQLDVTADELRLPAGIEVSGVVASLRGRLRPAELTVEPIELDAAAELVRTPDGDAGSVSVVARPDAPPGWDAQLVGRILGSEVGVRGRADLQAKTGRLELAGVISPEVLHTISGRVKVDVRKFFDFERLECRRASADFGPGWKFQHLSADVALTGIHAHGVRMDEGVARVELDPKRLFAPQAYARIGENFARGSYEHDFASREFRFLLQGQLRPLDIGEWFHEWWGNFFGRFDFPVQPPAASVDVHGFWGEGRRTLVFVFADAKQPGILGQKLASVRTRLFIRPGFYDGLELFGTDPAGGVVKGTFTVATDMETGLWRSLDFDGTSNIAIDVPAGMAGALAKPLLAPFGVSGVPAIVFTGHLEGPDLPDPKHQQVDVDVRAAGPFRFYDLPFEDVAFTVKLRDEELTVDANEAKFAGGAFRAHAKAWGAAPQRRLGFDATLTDASLGVAVAALQKFSADRKGVAPAAPGKFVQEKANVRMDIAASADGLYGNALSFHGGGNASLRGAEIGEVPLFGPLSELLKFTALRFTTATTSFKINGPKVEFPDVALRGANSAIDAHGEYALDRRQLDFRAKVFPFQESGSVLKSVVGAVLTPISNALEVKLTGSLDKPEWAFVIGPTNLLRSLSGESPDSGATAAEKAAAKREPEPGRTDGKPAPAPKTE